MTYSRNYSEPTSTSGRKDPRKFQKKDEKILCSVRIQNKYLLVVNDIGTLSEHVREKLTHTLFNIDVQEESAQLS